MRVLRLGNSQDLNPLVPEHQRSWRIAERMLQEAAGEPVETILKPIWMSAQLPGIIDGWMVRHRPEVVVLITSGIWYTYDSSLLKLMRKARFLGPAVTGWQKLAINDWFAQNRVYQAVRRLGLRTIGGVPFYEPAYVADILEACLRRVLAHEPAAVVYRTGLAIASQAPPANQRDCLRRQLWMHRRMSALCEPLHVVYIGRQDDPMFDSERELFGPDRLHWNAAGHAQKGEEDGRAMVQAWERAPKAAVR